MKHTNTAGRTLAIIAGVAATGGALAILLQDAFTSGHWSLDHMLMPVLVGITILSGHLIGSAVRDFKFMSAAGFALLFVLGTGLTVYTSVGRQAKTADTEVSTAETKNKAIADKGAELATARQRLTDAEKMVEIETRKGGCKSNCKDWKQRASEVRSHLKAIEGELSSLGAPAPVAPRAEKMAAVLAILGADKAQAKAALMLFEPFAFSLFLELTAIVAFGFGFRHSRKGKSERVEITPEPGPVMTAAPAKASSSERRAAVHSFVAAHAARHGHAPQIPAIQAMHRDRFGADLPKTTAWNWKSEAMAQLEPVRRLRLVGG